MSLPAPSKHSRRTEPKRTLEVSLGALDTPIGRLHVACTPDALVRVAHGADTSFDEVLSELAHKAQATIRLGPVAGTDEARRQLDEYFATKRRVFDLRVDLLLSSGFRRAAQQACADIGYGQVASYGQLAELAGSPKAARAVGSAMATNPVSIVIPCHRVVRSDGSLGNYGGGTDAKAWLQSMESANA